MEGKRARAVIEPRTKVPVVMSTSRARGASVCPDNPMTRPGAERGQGRR
jgi:hypothetical protein